MQKFLLLIFIFCIYISLAHGKEIPMVQIKDLAQDKPYFLQPYSQIYIDYSDKKSIKDIIQPSVQSEFKPLDVKSLDKNANAYWLRYKFHNLNQDSLPIALFSMGLEHISIYLLPISQESLLSEHSDIQAITKRSYRKYRDLIYISIPSGESFVYFHLQVEQSTYRNLIGAALRSFSFYRGDYQTFWTKNKESIYVFTLLFFGALGMMFFYNM
ncbi:MAG: hypothetical protein MUE81_23815, partial [Thermoflexibacter sp.]|nr:hypothetical protein [Thermoflexibacter sp.]